MEEVVGLQRHPGLRTLSVEHHHALAEAHQRLLTVTDADDAMAAAEHLLQFWVSSLSEHFRKEEELLLPVAARFGANIDDPNILRMLVDHVQIRSRVMQIRDQHRAGRVTTEALRELGAMMEAHVRLEERVIFPALEASLPPLALEEVGRLLREPDAG